MIKKLIFLMVFANRLLTGFETINWNRADSSILLIEEKRSISEEQKLVIQPGTKIIIGKEGAIEIRGEIHLAGTEQDSIYIYNKAKNSGFSFVGKQQNQSVFSHVVCQSETSNIIQTQGHRIRIENSVFAGGKTNLGGVIHAIHSEINIIHCHFKNNQANKKGGVIYAENSVVTMDRVKFSNNSTDYFGGIISLTKESHLRIFSSLFINNKALYGGILSAEQSTFAIYNATCVHNTALHGGLFYLNGKANGLVLNSILWNNLAAMGNLAFSHDKSMLKVDYSCYPYEENNFVRKNNVSMIVYDIHSVHENPQFLWGNKQYALQPQSPCIDAGNYLSFFENRKDYLGNSRMVGDNIDIGALEWKKSEKKQETIIVAYSLFHFSVQDSLPKIDFHVAKPSDLEIQIITASNEPVVSYKKKKVQSGNHEFIWDGTDSDGKKVQEGYYFFRIVEK